MNIQVPNLTGFAIYDHVQDKWHSGGTGANWWSIPMIFSGIDGIKKHIRSQVFINRWNKNIICVYCFYHNAVIVDLSSMSAVEDFNPQEFLEECIKNAQKKSIKEFGHHAEVLSYDPTFGYAKSLGPDGKAVA